MSIVMVIRDTTGRFIGANDIPLVPRTKEDDEAPRKLWTRYLVRLEEVRAEERVRFASKGDLPSWPYRLSALQVKRLNDPAVKWLPKEKARPSFWARIPRPEDVATRTRINLQTMEVAI